MKKVEERKRLGLNTMYYTVIRNIFPHHWLTVSLLMIVLDIYDKNGWKMIEVGAELQDKYHWMSLSIIMRAIWLVKVAYYQM